MLVVFDFDHTVVDGNTDTWITKLSDDVKPILKTSDVCWTDRMNAVFCKLHEKNFRKSDFDKCLQTLPFTKGMKELLTFISSQSINCVIISDSNTYFIDHLLKAANLRKVFSEIHTNPGCWNDLEKLCVEYYHSHSCHRCPANLCKGNALKAYIKNNNVAHQKIVYIGDGRGDYCPTLQLQGSDYVFARENYTLLGLLQQNPPHQNPSVISWRDGFDILSELKRILDNETVISSTEVTQQILR